MFKKIFAAIFLILLAAALAGAYWVKTSYQTGVLQEKIFETALPKFQNSTSTSDYFFRKVLGIENARTYLVLFLNNTELRPGGGFIGSYGVVRVKDGKPEILKVEGTEIIDNDAPNAFETPPTELSKYLKIKKWQFRDSNWSPDFPTSAKQSLQFYRKENGLEGQNISGVIAVTPSVFEELLSITGPVKAGSLIFNKDNFTETLEYESEYGYAKRGLAFGDRKQILTEFSRAMLPKLISTSFTRWSDYVELVPRMIEQKQIMFYSEDPVEEKTIIENGWGGEMKTPKTDRIMWVDANLGALKTDVAIKRAMTYSLNSKDLTATVTMNYNHTGKFDWRTTRYLDYARVFVPKGSKLVSVTGQKGRISDVEEGDEGDYHWFGAFISIEPGNTGQLNFTYELADEVKSTVKSGNYKLLVQKQLGLNNFGLTLRLNFDKKLITAEPAEAQEKFGDNRYDFSRNLVTDQSFSMTY